ncbi:MAG: RnfABCDGE type electron transport complex subunit D [Phycisphaeraceae bacterium]
MRLSRIRPTPPPWLPPVHDRRLIDRQWLLVALLLLAWGLLFFGYRAAVSVALTMVVTVAVHALAGWGRRSLGLGRPREARGFVVVLGLLGGLALPVTGGGVGAWGWPVVAGVVVGLSAVWVGRSHAVRLHPVAVLGAVMLLAGVVTARGATPVEAVLWPAHTLAGDVADVGDPVRGPHPWVRWEADASDAAARPWLERLVLAEQRQWLASPERMRRQSGEGVLPAMEDVLLGAVPGGVGTTGVALLVGLGLYLVYRRLSSGVMLTAALLGAVGMLLVMPVRTEAGWTVVAGALAEPGPAMGLMWVTYALLGTSLVWMVCVLAPMGMPMGWRGRAVYGAIVGAGGVAALWGIGEPWAGYAGLVAAGLVARPLDAWR